VLPSLGLNPRRRRRRAQVRRADRRRARACEMTAPSAVRPQAPAGGGPEAAGWAACALVGALAKGGSLKLVSRRSSEPIRAETYYLSTLGLFADCCSGYFGRTFSKEAKNNRRPETLAKRS